MLNLSEDMSLEEIKLFLTCARVGRLGVCIDGYPYIVPLGYVYVDGKIAFHTCEKGLKMEAIKRNRNVCFEVDEATSDISMYKSVIIQGNIEILENPEEIKPYLQKLIDKYRIPEPLEQYMSKTSRNLEEELKIVRICIITPKKITGRKYIRK